MTLQGPMCMVPKLLLRSRLSNGHCVDRVKHVEVRLEMTVQHGWPTVLLEYGR